MLHVGQGRQSALSLGSCVGHDAVECIESKRWGRRMGATHRLSIKDWAFLIRWCWEQHVTATATDAWKRQLPNQIRELVMATFPPASHTDPNELEMMDDGGMVHLRLGGLLLRHFLKVSENILPDTAWDAVLRETVKAAPSQKEKRGKLGKRQRTGWWEHRAWVPKTSNEEEDPEADIDDVDRRPAAFDPASKLPQDPEQAKERYMQLPHDDLVSVCLSRNATIKRMHQALIKTQKSSWYWEKMATKMRGRQRAEA